MSNSSDVLNLIVAAQLFSTYSTYITFGLGIIGSVINILVFTKMKIFQGNRCTFYLIMESVVDIGQLSQFFAYEICKLTMHGVEPLSTSLVWCKLRTMLSQWFRLLLVSIVCFSAIDQFLCTNPMPYLRQWSSLKIARYQVFLAICLSLLHAIPFGIYLQIIPSVGCIITNVTFKDYYSFFFYPVLIGLLPIFVSALFSILAYRNVRRIVRRQIPINRRKLEQQLTAMILVQVVVFVLLQIPFTIYRIYVLNLTIIQANTFAYALNQWVQVISIALIFVVHAGNFYIFLATSARFRRQVKSVLIKTCCQLLNQCCKRHPNTVHPMNGTAPESSDEQE